MAAINLNKHEIKKNEEFLFDANIWLMNLDPVYNYKKEHSDYKLFFDNVISNSKVRIKLPFVVLSEIVNRYLHDISFPKFCLEKGVKINNLGNKKNFYKENFRSSSDYRGYLNILLDDIKQYGTSIDLIPDKLGDTLKSKHILSKIPQELDFNDNLIYHICKKNNFKLVTNDKDFKNQGIEILTLNQNYFS